MRKGSRYLIPVIRENKIAYGKVALRELVEIRYLAIVVML